MRCVSAAIDTSSTANVAIVVVVDVDVNDDDDESSASSNDDDDELTAVDDRVAFESLAGIGGFACAEVDDEVDDVDVNVDDAAGCDV